MKFIFGLLLGLGLGVTIGLIIAPRSGEETRTLLNEQGQGILLRSGALSEQIRSKATEAIEQGRDQYIRTKNELTDRYSNARSGNL
jgi:gas vesicle protein